MKRKGKRRAMNIIICCIAAALAIAAAVVMVRSIIERQSALPRKYEEEVLAASERYGLDPNLVFAVIYTESSFRKDAVSAAGAKGLMQIMKTTGEWVKWRQGGEYDEERIFEPEYNIDIGCFLLAYLYKHYGGNLTYTAAAYNAGAGAVDGWIGDPSMFSEGVLQIPYGETKYYVHKVLYAYEKYTAQSNKN